MALNLKRLPPLPPLTPQELHEIGLLEYLAVNRVVGLFTLVERGKHFEHDCVSTAIRLANGGYARWQIGVIGQTPMLKITPEGDKRYAAWDPALIGRLVANGRFRLTP